MKVSRDQFAENRRKVVDVASRLFREHGFESVTLDQVMNEAGLTRGAFYGHFKSKDDLVSHACAYAAASEAEDAPATLQDCATKYLNADHRDNRAGGCAFASLGAESVRQPLEVRRGMTEGLRGKIAHMSSIAPGDSDDVRRAAAITSFSAMLGGLILARMIDDPALSDEVLNTNQAALTAAYPAAGER